MSERCDYVIQLLCESIAMMSDFKEVCTLTTGPRTAKLLFVLNVKQSGFCFVTGYILYSGKLKIMYFQ